MKILKTSLLALGITTLLSCNTASYIEPYPAFAKESYFEGCKSGGTQAFCDCSFRSIEATIPFDQFVAGNITSDSRFLAAVEQCARQHPAR